MKIPECNCASKTYPPHTQTGTRMCTHTVTQGQLLNSLKFCSQSIIAGQMPLFTQVTFSPLEFKDSLDKMSELPTYLSVLKGNIPFIKDKTFPHHYAMPI